MTDPRHALSRFTTPVETRSAPRTTIVPALSRGGQREGRGLHGRQVSGDGWAGEGRSVRRRGAGKGGCAGPASGKGVISPRRIMDDWGQQSCRVCLAKVPVVRDTNMVTGAEDVSGEGSSGGAGGATRAPWILLTCRSYYGYPTDTSVGTDHRHIWSVLNNPESARQPVAERNDRETGQDRVGAALPSTTLFRQP